MWIYCKQTTNIKYQALMGFLRDNIGKGRLRQILGGTLRVKSWTVFV